MSFHTWFLILPLAGSSPSMLEFVGSNMLLPASSLCSDFHVDFIVISLLSQEILTDHQNTASLSMPSPFSPLREYLVFLSTTGLHFNFRKVSHSLSISLSFVIQRFGITAAMWVNFGKQSVFYYGNFAKYCQVSEPP